MTTTPTHRLASVVGLGAALALSAQAFDDWTFTEPFTSPAPKPQRARSTHKQNARKQRKARK